MYWICTSQVHFSRVCEGQNRCDMFINYNTYVLRLYSECTKSISQSFLLVIWLVNEWVALNVPLRQFLWYILGIKHSLFVLYLVLYLYLIYAIFVPTNQKSAKRYINCFVPCLYLFQKRSIIKIRYKRTKQIWQGTNPTGKKYIMGRH